MRSRLAARWHSVDAPILVIVLVITRPAATQERAVLQGATAVKITQTAAPPIVSR
jgi:hypothetical protein